MKSILVPVLILVPGIYASAQPPARSNAVQVWKVTHPESGSVATPVRAGKVTLEFPFGPIQSGKNIDLLPTRVKHAGGAVWTRWSTLAWLTVKSSLTLSDGAKPLKRAGRSWKLYALLKDGRVVEATKRVYGTDSTGTSGDGIVTQYYFARFALNTSPSTQKDFYAKASSVGRDNVVNSEPLLDKPLLWRDVTELWLIDIPSLPVTTNSAK